MGIYSTLLVGLLFCSSASSDEQIKILSDAWYNGYTVKQEPRYNLILGTDTDGDCNAFFKCHNELRLDTEADGVLDDADYQFTQAEIDSYNKDGASWVYNSLDLNNLKVEVEG